MLEVCFEPFRVIITKHDNSKGRRQRCHFRRPSLSFLLPLCCLGLSFFPCSLSIPPSASPPPSPSPSRAPSFTSSTLFPLSGEQLALCSSTKSRPQQSPPPPSPSPSPPPPVTHVPPSASPLPQIKRSPAPLNTFSRQPHPNQFETKEYKEVKKDHTDERGDFRLARGWGLKKSYFNQLASTWD